jgi:hypothetical protein
MPKSCPGGTGGGTWYVSACAGNGGGIGCPGVAASSGTLAAGAQFGMPARHTSHVGWTVPFAIIATSIARCTGPACCTPSE